MQPSLNLSAIPRSHQLQSFFNNNITILGCGAVGSKVAERLARMGIDGLTLYDFDTVDAENVTSQAYSARHIGMPKVEALSDILKEINPIITINANNYAWDDNLLQKFVIIAVDVIKVRKQILEYILHNPMQVDMFYNVGISSMEGDGSTTSVRCAVGTNDYTFIKAEIELMDKWAQAPPPKASSCRLANVGFFSNYAANLVEQEIYFHRPVEQTDCKIIDTYPGYNILTVNNFSQPAQTNILIEL